MYVFVVPCNLVFSKCDTVDETGHSNSCHKYTVLCVNTIVNCNIMPKLLCQT